MDTRGTILRRWSGEIPVFAATLALFALCAALLANRGIALDTGPVLANARIYLFSIIAWMAVDAAYHLARNRPNEPFAALHRRYAGPVAIRRWIAGAPLLALCVLLMPFFSKMKAAIPLFNDYTWDATFIAWDRAIFFGYDAWQVLQPVFGYPVVTALLGLLYQLWFLLLYVGCLFMAFAAIDPGLRRQFFLSYTLSWSVIGGGVATALASVGPCFLGPLLGDQTFSAQMAYLNAADAQIPVMPLTVQQMLLDWHHTDANGLGSGITAMPSMHVAIAFLFWLAVRRISPLVGRWMLAFFVLTWIGSVHLAYHYAVDGLVSVILVAALWRMSGVVVGWWDNRLAHNAREIYPALRTKTVPAE
ncbi:phosphatase PAP2 family protein [Pelagerythrobacter marensis]|uniref:phosphatase PAP2 family protein n=1 Tax=Pelagerythrobacter marensis TaxID=543877 RepID=UPI00069D7818|nr:phosphatase PAP2 family protein [Pelagerythrobacter marensis]